MAPAIIRTRAELFIVIRATSTRAVRGARQSSRDVKLFRWFGRSVAGDRFVLVTLIR